MPWKDQSFLEWLISWFVQHADTILGFVIAFILAVFRTAHKYRKVDWLEALICGFLTFAASSVLEWLRFPPQVSIVIGGIIGFKGSLWTGALISKKLEIADEIRKQDEESS
jgi:lambda family phage holin